MSVPPALPIATLAARWVSSTMPTLTAAFVAPQRRLKRQAAKARFMSYFLSFSVQSCKKSLARSELF
jgi:hypothetical protein